MKENNKIKRIALMIAFVILFQYISLVVPFVESIAETATDTNGITWAYTLDDEGNATNVRYSSGTMGETVIIPQELDGHAVVSLLGGTSMGDYITILGSSNKTIVKEVTIPEGVISIGTRAFASCTNLISVKIPSSVTSIGEYAFIGCTSLTNIEVDENSGTYASIDGILFNKEKTKILKYPIGKNDSSEYEVPEGVTGIEYEAFYQCTNLTSIKISSSVTSIDTNAFKACTNLEGIEVDENNNNYSSIDGVLYNKDKTTLIIYSEGKKDLTEYAIPNGVTSIGDNAFYNCKNLTSINIPEGVTSIGDYAFYNCNNLTSVNIPKGVTSIGAYAFYYCIGLTSMVIPEGVTSIGKFAFYGCKGITSIEIPKGVTSIENSVFGGCSGLTSIKIPEGVTNIGDFAFGGCSGLTSIEIPENVTSIEKRAFSGCTSMTSINIPEGITSIEDNTFYNCNNLTSIKIPSSVRSIGYAAFRRCSGLTSIEIPSNVTSIAGYAFAECTNLTSILIPSSVTSIEKQAFYKCSNLVIKCYANSTAYQYAINNSIEVQTIAGIEYCKFNDINLYNKMKEQINQYILVESAESLELTVDSRALSITTLDISNANIEDLTGLEQFNKLTDLNASNNNISDISKLNNLYNLDTLDLSNNIISDISNFDPSYKLKSLNLSNNNISDISSMEGYYVPYLNTVDLSNNRISDITALDNKNISNLNLNNQTIEMKISNLENALVNILTKATDSKYNNGEEVTFDTNKCIIEDNKVKVSDDFTYNDSATITVNNGIMNGTTCTITVDDEVTAQYNVTGDKLEIIPYKNEEKLNIEDVDLYYSIDNGDFQKYTDKIFLSEGHHNVRVTFFGKEILNEDIDTNIEIIVIRRNGKIYIYSNSDSKKQYSLTGNEFIEYTEPIENTDIATLFVKIGENEAKEISIQNVEINENYEMYDTEMSNNVNPMIGNSEAVKAIRKNGIVTVTNSYAKIYAGQSVYKFYYSFDKNTWVEYNSELKVQNIEADTIYIKTTILKDPYVLDSEVEYKTEEYKIVDYGKLSQVLGIYNESGISYIFGQNRIAIEEAEDGTLLLNDENKIQKFLDNEVIDITEVAGNLFILKQDGIVYKMSDSYDDLQMVIGGTNFSQIDGVYALDNKNNIWKCVYNYDDDTYSYVKCDYTIENKIEKISSVIRDNVFSPYILYSNGKVVILKEDGTTEEVANNVIDISADDKDIYVLKYNSVMFNDLKIDISSIINNGEMPIKINKQGTILTNNGKYYELKVEYDEEGEIVSTSYSEEDTKTGIAKLGDYTYQDTNGNVYYIENDEKVEKEVNDIIVTKDESNLSQNEVYINVEVPENKYKITMPDGVTSQESTLKYTVVENGEYVFEFTDSTGYDVIRVVHVTSIQNRKETKVPEVTVLNGKIKLKSDDQIEYSLDNENWTEYTQEIEYQQPIYARVKNDNYECSILKVSMNENGELDVENTERREIQGQILTNSIGVNKDNIKVIEFETEVEENTEDEAKEEKKNFFDYISDIADNIIYSFSSTDGKYAGCYFDDNITEITYKDLNNNEVSIQNDKLNINNILNNNADISYSVLIKIYNYVSCYNATEEEEKQKVENGEIFEYELINNKYINGMYTDCWKETYIQYAYIDTQGNLISNVGIINKVKEKIGEDKKYAKIVGDGSTFYLLTESGEVYVATQGDNGTFEYFKEKFEISDIQKLEDCAKDYNIIFKLDLKDIINIYDSCTALTKDGKMVSLIRDNEEETSVVQKLQNQTDKYLVASHLGLKNGKLYNFDNIKQAVEVTAGKVVKSDTAGFGIYSESEKTIELFDEDDENKLVIPELAEGETYIDVEPIDEELPEFTDIVEYRDTYLMRLSYSLAKNNEKILFNYDSADQYAKCYALAKDGELWAYIGDYVVDTGVNLDYFGPTANYTLDNTKWTNQNVSLDFTENTKNKQISVKVKKSEEVIAENRPVIIEKNGEYSIEITDGKGRSYITTFNVENIDKIDPVVEFVGNIIDGVVDIKAYDEESTTGDYAKSDISSVEITYEEPTDNTEWTKIDTQKDEEGNTISQITGLEEGKVLYARTIDNAGNISQIVSIKSVIGKVTVKYQDTEGNTLKEDCVIEGEVGTNYSVEKAEIENYEFIEVVGNEQGTYTEEDQEVIYKYKKIDVKEPEEGKVIVKYQDIEGNTLKEDYIITGEMGTNYSVEKAEIENYEFIEVVGDEQGTYTEEDQEVIYKYKKIDVKEPEEGKLTVKYQDIKGNSLKEDYVTKGEIGTNYSVEAEEIEDYELVETIGNEEGTFTKENQEVIYKYKKLKGRIIIVFQDENGDPIKEDEIIIGEIGEDYKVDRYEIDGYELIEVIGNETGKYKREDQMVMFKYKKIETPSLPKTGQTIIIYLIIEMIIIICIGTLVYLKTSKNNKKE